MKVEGLRAGAAWAQSSHLGHSQLDFLPLLFSKLEAVRITMGKP